MKLLFFITLNSLFLSTGMAMNAPCNAPTPSSSPTITSFTPTSGPVGTLVTITGTNLSNPTAFTIGGTAAIAISYSGTTLVGMVMPGAVTGVISITTAGGTVNSSDFTVTATPYPSVQQGNKLVGTGNTGTADQGNSVAVSADGNTAIVGGYADNSGQGAVWIYIRSGTTWSQQGNKLVGTGNIGEAIQGYSVSISADGNTAIVGGPYDNYYLGAAWVFTRSGTTWSQQGSKLVGTGNTGAAYQGYSVSVSADGNTAIVGGPNDNYYLGAAWVFTRSGTTWSQQGSKLVGTGALGSPVYQGQSVSLSADGNTAIEGGYGDNSQQGATWVFTRSAGTWTQQGSKLVGTGGAFGGAYQGYSVALSADGNTAVEGGINDNWNQGATWVFTRSGTTWSQQGSKLVGTGNTGATGQGSSVAVSADGNTAIVGGYGDNSGQGAVWVFTRSGTTWSQQGSKLVGTGNTGAAQQGVSVSLSADGNTAIVGGPYDNNYQGATWVFVSQTPTITSFTPPSGPVGTLVTITGANLSNPTAFTIGGTAAIAISDSGTTLVGMVMPGAVTGVISITTVGGTVNSSGNFTVTATPYPSVQQGSKLVGTGGIGTDLVQGVSVAVSADGNTAIVGGVDDNSHQGAVWIFIRSGTTWSQQGSKLVGTGGIGTGIQQGWSVAISADGNTAIEGGLWDNSNQGATWVFTRSAGTWSQQGSKLVGTGNTGAAQQGCSVSLSADGKTAIEGGPYDNSNQGATWVFTRSGSTWSQQGSKLVGTGNSGAAQQGFHLSLSADGNTAIEGGYYDNSNQGAVWVFTRSAGTWSQQGNKLVGSGAVGTSNQGFSVSLSADGNTAIEGGLDDNSGQGAVWVFTRSGTTWSQQGSKLVGTGGIGTYVEEGWSVALSADGNTAIVGGQADNNNQGATWVFTRSGTTWSQQGSKLVGTGGSSNARQTYSLALSADGNTAIVGGPYDNNSQGAAWVFVSQTCANPTNGGTIASPQTICPGNSPSAFTSTADPSGYTGTLEYNWQYSVSPFTTWNDIASSNSNTYASGAISVTTEFQRLARVNCMSDWSGAVASNIVTVVVTPSVGTPTAITISAGTEPTCQLTNGTTTTTYATTATNNTGFNWSLSNGAAGSIGATTGIMTWANGFSGTVNIQVTANGCNGPSAMVIRTVTVNIRPIPTITGPASACVNSAGNVYTTETGMTTYTWSISASGIITSGTGTNSIIVTWNIAGAQTVSVNYTNGCNAAAPTVYNVTVNALPTPSLFAQSTLLTQDWSGTTLNSNVPPTGWGLDVVAGSNITYYMSQGTYPTVTPYNGDTRLVDFESWTYSTGTNRLKMTTPISTIGFTNITVDFEWYTDNDYSGTNTEGVTLQWSTDGVTWTNSTFYMRYNATNQWVLETQVLPAGAQGQATLYVAFLFNSNYGDDCHMDIMHIKGTPVSTSVCAGSTGNVYVTDAGQSNYLWTVSAGGTITAGGTTNSNTITVTWNTAGAQTVSVNYTNVNSCTAVAPTELNVTVNPLPLPTLAGPTPVCNGATGNVYTTQAGMTNYIWAVSAGGTITAGGTTNSNTVTVTWSTTGAQSVSVNYSNSNGCNAAAPTVYNVTVNALPSPTLTGPASVCVNYAGNVYNTQAGMTNYVWSVSAGGTITAGGTSTSSIVTVTWNTTGAQTVSVNYSNSNGCNAAAPTVYNVTVNALPSPAITGPASVCFNSTGNVYTTQAGMTNYVWSVSAGGTITAGGSTTSNTVTVTWSATGTQTVSVKYTNANGCTNAVATVYNVTVNALPSPTLTGPASVCFNSTGNVYTTQAGMTNYNWAVSAGGTITAGGSTTSSTVTVTWSATGTQTVSVKYTNANGCTNAVATVYNVTVNALPSPTITGPASACVNSAGNVYTTETGMTAYTWSISASGLMTSGAGTNSITVTWNIAGAQTVSVNYTNGNGCMASAATIKNVTINPLPVPTITGFATVCAGTTGITYTTETGMTGYTWSVSAGGIITAGSGTSTITVTWTTAGAKTVSVNYTNPNGCTGLSPTVKNVTVNPVPVPTISGPNPVCMDINVTYITESGMTSYIWILSAGGVITAGAGTNAISIVWASAGTQTVSVNYTNSYGCTASSATVYNITVNPLPVPTITGSGSVCAGATGVTYTTETGMTGYSWTISAGGTITSGTGTSTITVIWNTTGAQTVSVNYVNSNGCTATSATVKNVTVNALPVPTITGAAAVCAGTTGVNYTTQAGMTSYSWSISASGVITSGAGSNSIMVTWTTAGSQTISVNYINGNGCLALTPTVKNVTVNPLPVPTITGSTKLCAGTSGVNYSTETGMTGYIWSVSAGGTITAGAGTDQITVTWSIAGTQTVSVTYTNSNGCSASSPTIKNVTVNPVYIPTISGIATLCISTQTYVYTTETGMSNYIWGVSPGGTITSGGTTTSHTVTVRWISTGPQWVSVNYSNSYGCSTANATIYPVIVNPVPVPAITGTNSVCAGTTGVVYTTQAGMTNYNWNVSLGGTITAGGTATSNTVTVTWNTPGTQTVTVNYANSFGCTAASPASFHVTVNALPQPTLTGPVSMCVGTTGNVYTTQSGMYNYNWVVSSGGTITAGGTSGSNTVTVTWNTAGTQHVSVDYNNANGCHAALPTTLNVTVNALPVPTISGPTVLCSGISGIFTTETGKSNYTWTVSTGGTIVTGGGTSSSSITVKWTASGSQWVRVNYTNSTGCRATTYTQFNITVNALPDPTISGPNNICQGSIGLIYTTQAGMSGYLWTISTGGTITAGTGTNAITVSWTGSGTQWVKVNYSNAAGCSAISPVQFNVTVNAAPVPSISGTFSLCAGTTVTYSTEASKTNYVWTVSSGGTILSGAGTRQVNVLWSSAGANTISVIYTTSSGCAVLNPTVKAVTVYAIPTPTITGPTSPCVGAYVYYSTEAGMTNYSWALGGSGGIIYSGFNSRQISVKWVLPGAKTVSVNYTSPSGCRSLLSTVLNVTAVNCPDTLVAGIDTIHSAGFSIFPNPNDGRFTALIQCECKDNCSLDVFNMMGVKVFEITSLNIESRMEVPIDLQNLPDGIYIVIFQTSDQYIVRKIVINK